MPISLNQVNFEAAIAARYASTDAKREQTKAENLAFYKSCRNENGTYTNQILQAHWEGWKLVSPEEQIGPMDKLMQMGQNTVTPGKQQS